MNESIMAAKIDVIYNSYKIAVFTYHSPHFCFPWRHPLSRKMLHGWKDNSVLAKPLTACTYLSSIVSDLYDA